MVLLFMKNMFRIFDSVWKRINRSYNVSLIACATRTVQQSAHTANKHSPPAVAAVETCHNIQTVQPGLRHKDTLS